MLAIHIRVVYIWQRVLFPPSNPTYRHGLAGLCMFLPQAPFKAFHVFAVFIPYTRQVVTRRVRKTRQSRLILVVIVGRRRHGILQRSLPFRHFHVSFLPAKKFAHLHGLFVCYYLFNVVELLGEWVGRVVGWCRLWCFCLSLLLGKAAVL